MTHSPSVVAVESSAEAGQTLQRREAPVLAETIPIGAGWARLRSDLPFPPVLTDAEIDDICAGLKQNAAKVRFLRDVLKVPVQRKPNGRPLVLRADWERRSQPADGRVGHGPRWSKTTA